MNTSLRELFACLFIGESKLCYSEHWYIEFVTLLCLATVVMSQINDRSNYFFLGSLSSLSSVLVFKKKALKTARLFSEYWNSVLQIPTPMYMTKNSLLTPCMKTSHPTSLHWRPPAKPGRVTGSASSVLFNQGHSVGGGGGYSDSR